MSKMNHNQGDATTTAKKGAKVAVVRSLYNRAITDALLASCLDELKRGGVSAENITLIDVPGAFELPYACQRVIARKKPDAVIALGCIVRGGTPHFDFIANACCLGIMEINVRQSVPVTLGVLTVNTLAQAKDRVRGGKQGDKGTEAARTALHLINLPL